MAETLVGRIRPVEAPLVRPDLPPVKGLAYDFSTQDGSTHPNHHRGQDMGDRKYATAKEWRRRWFNPAWHELAPAVRGHYEGLHTIGACPVISLARLDFCALPKYLQRLVVDGVCSDEVVAVYRLGVRAPVYWALRWINFFVPGVRAERVWKQIRG